jgi:hypothetical protein
MFTIRGYVNTSMVQLTGHMGMIMDEDNLRV